jgi:hypothetical protein
MNAHFSKIILTATFVAGCVGLAQAQIAPNDTGAGKERGVQSMNNSGEVGTVTLFARGPNSTLVVLHVQQSPDHPQPAALQRAHGCGRIESQMTYKLNDVVSGHSATVVPASEDRLLSGNYSAVVHANRAEPTRYVNCGHLYE